MDSSSPYMYQEGVYVQPELSQVLVELVARDNRLRPRKARGHLAMEELFAELDKQDTPVLLAVDEVQHLLRPSAYLDANYRPIDTFNLAVPRLLLQYAARERSFVRVLRAVLQERH